MLKIEFCLPYVTTHHGHSSQRQRELKMQLCHSIFVPIPLLLNCQRKVNDSEPESGSDSEGSVVQRKQRDEEACNDAPAAPLKLDYAREKKQAANRERMRRLCTVRIEATLM